MLGKKYFSSSQVVIQEQRHQPDSITNILEEMKTEEANNAGESWWRESWFFGAKCIGEKAAYLFFDLV